MSQNIPKKANKYCQDWHGQCGCVCVCASLSACGQMEKVFQLRGKTQEQQHQEQQLAEQTKMATFISIQWLTDAITNGVDSWLTLPGGE